MGIPSIVRDYVGSKQENTPSLIDELKEKGLPVISEYKPQDLFANEINNSISSAAVFDNILPAGVESGNIQAEEVLAKKTICISLSLKRQGRKRHVPNRTEAISTETDRDFLIISKLLVDSPELDAITSLDGKIRNTVKGKALPANMPLRGCYLLPTNVVATLDEELTVLKSKRAALVEDYAIAYPSRIQEAKVRLGMLFNPNDYIPAESVRQAFAMDWSYIEPSNAVPGALKEISRSIFQREVKNVGARCQEMLGQIEQGLVEYMDEFIGHIVGSLVIKEDGKPRVFKVNVINNFKEFLKQLEQMNITGNIKIKELGEKAAQVMEGVDPKVLRKDMSVRATLQEKLTELKTLDLQPLLQNRPSRRFSFENDE